MRRMGEVAPVFRRLAHDEKVEFLMADRQADDGKLTQVN